MDSDENSVRAPELMEGPDIPSLLSGLSLRSLGPPSTLTQLGKFLRLAWSAGKAPYSTAGIEC